MDVRDSGFDVRDSGFDVRAGSGESGGGGGLVQTETVYSLGGVAPSLGAADGDGLRLITGSALDGLYLWDPDGSVSVSDQTTSLRFSIDTAGGHYPLEGVAVSSWYTKGPILVLGVGTPADTDYIGATVEAISGSNSAWRVALGWWNRNYVSGARIQAGGLSLYYASGSACQPNARVRDGGDAVLVATDSNRAYPCTARVTVTRDDSSPSGPADALLTFNAGADFATYGSLPGTGPGCWWGVGFARVATGSYDISELRIGKTG